MALMIGDNQDAARVVNEFAIEDSNAKQDDAQQTTEDAQEVVPEAFRQGALSHIGRRDFGGENK